MGKNKGIDDFMRDNGDAIMEAYNDLKPKLDNLYRGDVIELVQMCYQLADKVNSQKEVVDNISCSKGCSFCCHASIGVSIAEASTIASYMITKGIEPNLNLVKRHRATKDFDSMKFNQKKCSLLDEQGSCSVYEVRPLVCRMYNSTDEPELCKTVDMEGVTTGTLRSPSIAAMIGYLLHASDNQHVKLHDVMYEVFVLKKHR